MTIESFKVIEARMYVAYAMISSVMIFKNNFRKGHHIFFQLTKYNHTDFHSMRYASEKHLEQWKDVYSLS